MTEQLKLMQRSSLDVHPLQVKGEQGLGSDQLHHSQDEEEGVGHVPVEYNAVNLNLPLYYFI